jgi:hypothetical protein
MADEISYNERFLNLALINMGEALSEYANLRQRGATPSDPNRPFGTVQLKLRNAIAALGGEVYVAPVDPQHIGKGK